MHLYHSINIVIILIIVLLLTQESALEVALIRDSDT